MKQLFIFAIALLITLALGGCTRNNTHNNITAPNVPAESAPAVTTPQLHPVNIHVEFATDELMSQYESFHELVLTAVSGPAYLFYNPVLNTYFMLSFILAI